MTPQEVWDYYGNSYQFQKRTGMTSASLRNWVAWGRIPEASQYKIERLTKNEPQGQLKTQWTKEE
jgi:hypothetical protein